MILISTEFGDMKAILYPETPHHRDNYIKLTREGWYNGSVFHRVINGFMIQGGAGKGGLDTDYRIPAEFVPEYFHKKGAIAAARTGDHVNPARESSGCQFYIVQGRKVTDEEITMTENQGKFKYSDEQREIYRTIGGTPFLDYQYTVFGEVVDGLEVIDRIATVQTDAMDKPLKDVKMNVRIIEKKPQ
ncbi:MAG: peptidylprolyl isomerase [Bacteroidales bacterium]|nr:peptidylprolyl isomerase [Bacteroidales bacterium]